MREVLSDAGQVIFERCKGSVNLGIQQKFEFCLVELKAIHLLVEKGDASNDRVWMKDFLAGGAEACVAGERPMFFKPSTNCPLGYLQMCALAKNSLGIGE